MQQRFLCPEVVQTSAMDCGPGCLKAALEGFGIPVNYGRLREACQTDVDGTSIDTLEEISNFLGLDAEQVMVPVDHLLLESAPNLPAIVVVELANGFTHFVVAWRSHRTGHVQVMDPAKGRRWPKAEAFLDEVFRHVLVVPAPDWREWAGTDDFLDPLRELMARLGLRRSLREDLTRTAVGDSGWQGLGQLDAAIRLTTSLVDRGAIRRGREASGLVGSLTAGDADIPDEWWSVRARGTDEIELRGAVLVRLRPSEKAVEVPPELHDLRLAAGEAPLRPAREMLRALAEDGLLAPLSLVALVGIAAVGATFEALLFRGLLDLAEVFSSMLERTVALATAGVFVAALLAIEVWIALGNRDLGRAIELRLRRRWLQKLPLIGDRYFRSRPVSDLAERAHSVFAVRGVPAAGSGFLRASFETLATVLGLIWIHPAMTIAILGAAVAAVAVPLLGQSRFAELDLKVRTLNGGLMRFFHDALTGLVAMRTHGAERQVRREFERLLDDWLEARVAMLKNHTAIDGVQIVAVLVPMAWVLLDYAGRTGGRSGLLILAWWGLNLPFRGRTAVYSALAYVSQKNVLARLLEPLGAPEEAGAHESPMAEVSETPEGLCQGGVTIRFEAVGVRAAGHQILEGIDLQVGAGEHVAVIGPSGAGKSTLLATLLGWHSPSTGQILIDDRLIEPTELRRYTAWVDPSVRLWNRTFLGNLVYGNGSQATGLAAQVIDVAELREVLESLQNGLQTPLGEAGGLVSGGEGQRVRLGRALLRPDVRLVLFDEPFRGLGRGQRARLLETAREHWKDATFICVTHDLLETRGFSRVVVVEHGCIVEDGQPEALLSDPSSRYVALLGEEEEVRQNLWGGSLWTRWTMADGRLERQP